MRSALTRDEGKPRTSRACRSWTSKAHPLREYPSPAPASHSVLSSASSPSYFRSPSLSHCHRFPMLSGPSKTAARRPGWSIVVRLLPHCVTLQPRLGRQRAPSRGLE